MGNPLLAPQVLPIIWAIVAIVTALALYRTSETLLATPAGGRGKKLRLTGSVVIAALTFYGLSWATRLQLNADPNVMSVSAAELSGAREQASALVNRAMQVSACRSIDDGGNTCEQLSSDMENQTRALAKRLSKLGMHDNSAR